jgi:chromate reductase, NAD(P)H dehydrogenase (quinone)
MHVLGVSGSLRVSSANSDLLGAAATLAPGDVRVTLYRGLGALPHFNPDVEALSLPAPVADWRAQVGAADAILISSPEYAHGVPGVLKNGLDWLVGGVEGHGKPVALLNASLMATHAHASLTETLTTMAANVVAAASVTLPVAGRNLGVAGIVADSGLAGALRAALAALADAARARPHAL